MNRLWMRLTLAFTLVILVAVGAVAILIKRTADAEFRQYITRSGMMASGSGMEELITFYRREGSWQGVESLLTEGVLVGRPTGGIRPMDFRPDRAGIPGTIRGRLDVVLAGAGGKVVFDSAGEDTGKRLRPREREKALSIVDPDSQEVIGYLLIAIPQPVRLGALEQRFLDRLQNALVIGAALAVGLGLIAGAILSRSLTAPLQRLAAAARAVAGRDFSRRVEVEGSTEMADVARSFNEMTAALEQSEQQRQNMVSDVAHELRTPLSVLQGNLRAILDDVYALDKAEISRLYDETRLLGRLVDDLRELALADAGQLRLHLRPTDAAQVVCSTTDNLALVADAQGVTLSARVTDDLPAVQADPDRVAQVLRNLLVNALRHTLPGGSVTVTVTRPRSAAAVEIAVADTGEGIAPEDLPHVFERFWRADPARARTGRARSGGRDNRLAGGTGLGLSVAQSLVQAQGGRIWVDSLPGEGTTFRFTLPLAHSSL